MTRNPKRGRHLRRRCRRFSRSRWLPSPETIIPFGLGLVAGWLPWAPVLPFVHEAGALLWEAKGAAVELVLAVVAAIIQRPR